MSIHTLDLDKPYFEFEKWCVSCGEIVFAVLLAQVNSVFLVLVLRSIYISKSSQDSRSKKGQKNHSLAR